MIDLFISYATKDSQLAYRLFGDIIKSGGKAYLYERQNTLVNFEDEIKTYIESTRGFCLVDSAAAREAKYVNYECRLALAQKHILENNLFFVLLAQKNIGPWREKNVLFKPINLIKYLDLTLAEYKSDRDKTYDYHDYYFNAVNKICEKLELSFAMPHPSLKDFDKELNVLSVDGETVDLLKNDYKHLLSNFKDSKSFEVRANLINDNIRRLKIETISPYLLIGSYQLQEQRFALAETTYSKVISTHNEDPRGWIGLSYTYLGLGDLKKALYNISIGEQIVLNNKKNPNLFCHYPNIIHNKIKLLIACKELEKAKLLMDTLDKKFLKLFEFKMLKLILQVKQGRFLDYLKLYDELIGYYSNNIISNNERLLLGDLQFSIARYYNKIGDFLRSIQFYESAIHYCPENVQFNAELSQAYYVVKGFKNELSLILSRFRSFNTSNPHLLYYLGMIKYLNKERRAAKKIFKEVSPELNYPYYSKLVPKRGFLSSILRIKKS